MFSHTVDATFNIREQRFTKASFISFSVTLCLIAIILSGAGQVIILHFIGFINSILEFLIISTSFDKIHQF